MALKGEIPSPLNPPTGCSFHPRCPIAIAECATRVPIQREIKNRIVACHLAL
ncbi:MAG: oligopeptide/dipeptide ABC transporter ATP-binding protein [Aestuariivirga sp.]